MRSMPAEDPGLIDRLPKIRGRYTAQAPLGMGGWFKCGGTAEVLFKPADFQDLVDFLSQSAPQAPAIEMSSPVCYAGEGPDFALHVFGAMSNTIIRDGGLPGVTIRLGREFAGIEIDGDLVRAGALALDANVAQVAAESGLAGLEFFSGIPGTIGGAVKMNAGCYGVETKDVLVECTVLDRMGFARTLTPKDLDMTYRHTNLPDDWIVTQAVFKGVKGSADNVLARMAEIKSKREESQPIREKTGGSTFANPSPTDLAQAGLPADTKVWKLIDDVGGRGLMVGGAMMSEKHCNFMINTGTASARDLEALGDMLISRVAEKFGIALRWEIKRMGVKA